MDFKEKDLENIIYQNTLSEEGRKKLEERGLSINGKVFRQLNLAGYGRLDLMTVYKRYDCLEITIYELKEGKVNTNTLLQACRYLTAVKQIIESKTNRKIYYRVVLLGREVELNGDFAFLYNFLSFATIVTYEYTIEGISFETIDKDFIKGESKLNPDDYRLSMDDMREIIELGDTELPF